MLCKSVRKAERYPAENPKIKFNRRYNLRQKAVHPSINTEKEESVLAEFKSPEGVGGDNRINTEFVNSQTFHSNRVMDKKFW